MGDRRRQRLTQARDDATFRSLVDLLQFRAAHGPDDVAYVYLTDGESQEVSLTYGELALGLTAAGELDGGAV